MSTMWMIDTGYGGPALARSVEENNYIASREMRCIVSVWTIFSIIRYFNIKSSEDRGDITIIPDCVGESGPVVSVEKFPGPTPQSPAPSYLSCPTLTAGRQRQDEQFGQ